MALSDQQFGRLQELSGKAKLTDAEINELEGLQNAASGGNAPQGDAAIKAQLAAQVAKDYPRSMTTGDRMASAMALEGGGAAAGQAIGALPVLSGPTLGLSVPVGGFIGGAAGNAASQLRQRANGERAAFSVPEAVGAGVASMVPGAPMAGAGVKAVVKEGLKQGAANVAGVAAQTYGEDRKLPSIGQAMMAAGGGMAGAAIGRGLDTGAKVTAAERKAIYNGVQNDTLAAARAAGYKIAPSHIKDAPAIAGAIEWLAGSAQTRGEVEGIAQEVNAALARQAIGAGEIKLNVAALEGIRQEQGKVYAEVAGLSSTAAKALEDFRTARDYSRGFWKETDINYTVKAEKAAKHWDNEAAKARGVLEAEMKKAGRDDLVPAFEKARVTIAKTHLIEDAMNTGNGAVFGDIIARRRKAGKTITTDELEIIANFAEATGISGKHKAPAAVAHPLAALGAITGGAVYGGNAGQAMMAGGTVIAGPLLARKLLLSDPVQDALMRPTYSTAMPQDFAAAMGSLSAMSLGRQMAQPEQRPVPYR